MLSAHVTGCSIFSTVQAARSYALLGISMSLRTYEACSEEIVFPPTKLPGIHTFSGRHSMLIAFTCPLSLNVLRTLRTHACMQEFVEVL